MNEENIPVWITNKNGKKCIRITKYLHSSKESNICEAEELGMHDNIDFMNNFMYTLYEVKIELEVYKDGTSKILKVDDKNLC